MPATRSPAQIEAREIRSSLKELRDLRKEALAARTAEPEPCPENEPRSPPPPANDDAMYADHNEPAAAKIWRETNLSRARERARREAGGG